jgi:hypothetical protein
MLHATLLCRCIEVAQGSRLRRFALSEMLLVLQSTLPKPRGSTWQIQQQRHQSRVHREGSKFKALSDSIYLEGNPFSIRD